MAIVMLFEVMLSEVVGKQPAGILASNWWLYIRNERKCFYACINKRLKSWRIYIFKYSNCDAVIYNGFALANWFVNEMSKATSHSLYYRKFCLNAPKVYSSKTDVYSNCDAVIYNGFALANWFVIAMNKATSHGLY